MTREELVKIIDLLLPVFIDEFGYREKTHEKIADRILAALAEEAAQKPTEEHPDLVTGTMPYSPTPTESIAEEPLAVLADRKDCWICEISGPGLDTNASWCIEVAPGPHCWWAKTYPEAEAKARAYLEGLDDVKGGKV